MTPFIEKFRETINLFIYKRKNSVLLWLRILRFFLVIMAMGTIIYFIGFPQTPHSNLLVLRTIRLIFFILIFSYFVRFFFDFEPRKFLHNHKYEGLVLLLILLNSIYRFISGSSITEIISGAFHLEDFNAWFIAASCIILFGLSMMEIVRGSKYIRSINLSPPTFLIGSFILLILTGTGLLMLPEMTQQGGSMPFLSALFTSTSASCVTGLTVVDTATYFTFKGKIVLMMLMQLGGLNIISFTSFFVLFSQGGVGLKHQAIIMNFMSFDSLSNTKKLLRDIFILAFGIELIGAIILYFTWSPNLHFHSVFDRIFQSLFHSVSAFNNAGFSLFSNGLYDKNGPGESYIAHLVIAFLVILGGLGFHVIKEVFGFANQRERIQKPWKSYSVGSKLVLYTTFTLIIFGMLFFFLGELHNPAMYKNAGDFGHQSNSQKIITAFFQSVTTRSAGFNTVDFTVISTPFILVSIILMFIGASPGSTGGGIKTTTFATLFLSSLSTIRNKNHVQVFKRTIPKEIINKAYTILLFSISIILTCIIGLSFSDPHISIDKLSFEVVSAYCTVGLSMGITAGLSSVGKAILILCMFVGRVGILTLAFSLSKKTKSNNYTYPSSFVMVG